MSNDNSKNEIEVKYIKKMARVRINYINKQGSELAKPVMKNMQVGELYNMEAAKKYVDSTNVEWNLYQSKPSKLIVSENDTENVLTLVYDVIKADVFIYYKTRNNLELKSVEKTVAVANKEFTPQIPEKIVDNNGFSWKYAKDTKATIFVEESETNEVTLMYDELKKRVVTRYVDEKGMKIKDDVVEIVQVGKEIELHYEPFFKDIYDKHWKYNNVNKNTIKVSEDEDQNIFIVTYEKLLANIVISMFNENGQRIKEDFVEKAQIGSTYQPAAIKEIQDSNGKYWICTEENKNLTVSDSEVKNKISYKYKPLATIVFVQYVDIEGNQLLPQKEKEVQAGSVFVPELINTLQGQDGRVWILAENNVKEFKTNKHKEENIIKVNYDKKLVDIILVFKDIQGKILKTELSVKAQLGSEFKAGIYEKITSDNGERWMVTKTEPSRMFVREGSKFTLIYDEIRAKVIIKCVNISDSKSIIDDTEYITKLGGVYVPNVMQKIVDKLKRRWVYVGEPGMSIIAKENDQENIITLKYEPDRAKVTLKYLNKNQQMVHQDVVNAEQIGSEVAIKEYEKIFEKDGLGWKLKNMSRNTLIVDEDESKNIVISNYEPLLVPVATRYIDEDVNEITDSKIDNIQVGEKFNAVVLPRVTDKEGKIWVYSDIKVMELIVKDDQNNKVNIKYIPLKKNVTEKFVDLSGTELEKEKISAVQVGDFYTLKKKERVIDSEDKSWIYQKSSAEKIKVLEEEEKNIITNYYDKELTKVTIKYQTDTGVTLAEDKTLDLQIGSIYKIEPKPDLTDNEKLTWKLSDKNKLEVKIAREENKNTFIIIYEKYMVNVYDKYINEATGDEVIKPSISKHQVGVSYLVKVKECVIDEEGKHWVQAAKSENRIFSSSYKIEPITIVKEESRNVTIVKYKPKLAESTIRYQDPLGRQIKAEEVKKLQVGSVFDEEVPTKLVDNLGNKWTYNPNSNRGVKISEDPKENLIILAYEEEKGTITFKYLDKAGNELREPTQKLVQIGNIYVPQFDMIITDSNGCVWEYAERNIEKLEVKDDDKENIIKLTYVPLNVNVEIELVDLWGNEISKNKVVPAQLGSQFKPTIKGNYTNEKTLLYKLVKTEPESITVKEIPISAKSNPNKFKLTFEPVNSDIIILFQDLDGNLLKEEQRLQMQVGKKYTPQPAEFITDKKGNQWQLASAKTDEIIIKENEKENTLKYVYEVAKAEIIIRFLTVDGLVIIKEKNVSQQVGSEYVPNPEKFILDADNKKWKLLRVQPVNLKVGSINNIVTITYQEEKTNVIWQYCDEDGNILKPDEKHEVQVGLRYTPIVKDKVIYDASQIWRLLKIEPYEIIVSEKADENIVKLIYSNTKVENVKEEKKEIVNPFANTLRPEDEKDITNKNNIFDATDVTGLKSNEDTVIFGLKTDSNENVSSDSNKVQVEESFEFEDPYLKKLARSMALTNSEKIAIDKLNALNGKIIDEFRKSRTAYLGGQESYDYTNIEKLTIEEKEMIKSNLESLISKDLSGARMLKIFEHIVESEGNDAMFGRLQQRRAVLITDYFLDKPLDDSDKILYICERGKNTAEIELINKKLANPSLKNRQEALDVKTVLYYKKLVLDNYYKARNIPNDNYFTDASAKETAGTDIVVGVTNMMVNQALTLLRKDELDFAMKNEVEAIISLCTPQQVNTIKMEIDKLDSKQKRNANKLLQEIKKGK